MLPSRSRTGVSSVGAAMMLPSWLLGTVDRPYRAGRPRAASYRWHENREGCARPSEASRPASATLCRAMAVVDLPFDLVEVKLAAPLTRPGTVAKADVDRAAVAPRPRRSRPSSRRPGTARRRCSRGGPRPIRVRSRGSRSTARTTTPWCSCGTSRPRSTASSRSRPRCSTPCPGPGGSTWSKRVPRVGSALAALERPLVLVLDDLHAVANPSCLDVLAALLGYVPAGSQIAVASREEPALPLARWRAHGLVRRDRRVGPPAGRAGGRAAAWRRPASSSTRASCSELTERTEGWPAGLYLAALSLQAGAPTLGDRRELHAATTGSCPSTSASSSCPGCRRPRRGSSQHTSVLDRMCGGLCDAVLADDAVGAHARDARARERLRRAARPARRVVSLPPPVRPAAARRARAQRAGRGARTQPPRDGLVHRQRPDRRGDRLRARRGRDGRRRRPDRRPRPAAPLRRSHRDRWRSGSAWFGDDELVRYPALAVYGAWVRVLTGRPAEAERWLALADGATSTIPLSDGSATIEPWVATLRAHMMPDGVEHALADADLALNQLPPESPWIPTALLARGIAHALLGATDRATGLAARDRRARAGRRRRRGGLPRTGTARAPRGQAGSLGRGSDDAHARRRAAGRRSGPRRLLVERDRARCDGACRAPRGETRRCPRGADARAPAAAACSTTAFRG